MIARKAVQWQPKDTSIGLAPSRLNVKKYIMVARRFLQNSVVLSILGFLALLACYFVVMGMNRADSYKLVAIQNEAHNLQKTNADLKVDIAKLKSPARIQEIAESQLGMVLPDRFIFSTKNAKGQSSQNN